MSFRRQDWRDVTWRVAREVDRDRVFTIAGAVAFFLLLSIPPTVVLLVSLFGLFADGGEVRALVDAVGPVLPASGRQVFREVVDSIVRQTNAAHGTSLLVSVLASVWSATSGTAMLVEGVNLAYDERDERTIVQQRWLALRFTLGVVGFGVFSLVSIAALPPLLDRLGWAKPTTELLEAARWLGLVAAFWLGVTLTYRYAPQRRPAQWSWLSVGSVLATLSWLAASAGFSVYLDVAGDMSRTYGSLGGLAVFMLWLYMTAVIVLIGAEVNAEVEHQTSVDSTVGPPRPRGQRGAVKADGLGASKPA